MLAEERQGRLESRAETLERVAHSGPADSYYCATKTLDAGVQAGLEAGITRFRDFHLPLPAPLFPEIGRVPMPLLVLSHIPRHLGCCWAASQRHKSGIAAAITLISS